MSPTLYWILFAAAVVTVFGIGWAKEYEKRTDAERLLDESEAERLKLKTDYQRYRAGAAERRGQDTPRAPGSWQSILPGDPTSKHLLAEEPIPFTVVDGSDA